MVLHQILNRCNIFSPVGIYHTLGQFQGNSVGMANQFISLLHIKN